MRSQLLALVFGCAVTAIGRRGATTPTPASPPSGARAPRNAAEFNELFKQVSNWGRWGKDDLGAVAATAAKLNRWEFMVTLGARSRDWRDGISCQHARNFLRLFHA